jgi:serine/threonine-protein kinase HipA
MTLPAEIEVWLDESTSGPERVGLLKPSFQGGRTLVSMSFQYDPDYLGRANSYQLSPDIPMIASRQYTPENQVLFGAFADAAPDEWGRKIIEANHANRLAQDTNLTKSIGDFDFLIGVSDHTRIGALRLKTPGSDGWLSSDSGVANIHELDRIVHAAQRYENNEATDEDVAYLNDIATSPGGARPKANVVLDDGQLAIAKLPHSKDSDIDVESWEALALTIASNCGIRVPGWQRRIASPGKSVLVVNRFDRVRNERRLGYISAATALEIGPYDDRRVTYEQFSDTIAELSVKPEADLHEMFARIALTVLINNVDDHWRNHGFLHSTEGWRLAPAFDINPSVRRGVMNSRPISDQDDPRSRDLRNLVKVASSFQLTEARAGAIIRLIAAEVEKWPRIASDLGIAKSEQDFMKRAFSEEQLGFAESLGV